MVSGCLRSPNNWEYPNLVGDDLCRLTDHQGDEQTVVVDPASKRLIPPSYNPPP